MNLQFWSGGKGQPQTRNEKGVRLLLLIYPWLDPHSLLDLYFRPYAECFKPANKNIYSYSPLNNLEHQKNNTKSPTCEKKKCRTKAKPNAHFSHNFLGD